MQSSWSTPLPYESLTMAESPTPSDAPQLQYLEDLQPGRRFTSGEYLMDEALIKGFATQFDPQPFHLDHEAAKSTLFGGLAASGWHTAAVTMRLLVDGGLPLAGGIIGASGDLSWPKPTRPGDVLHVESEVISVTPSRSKPGRGMAVVRIETRNQKGDVLQVFTVNVVVSRRE